MMKNPFRSIFSDGSTLRIETIRAIARETRLYVIFFTPRSGSSWLTDMACNSGLLGCPHEWFNYEYMATEDDPLGKEFGTRDVNTYLRALIQRSRSHNGVAGVKLSYYQTMFLAELLDEPFDSAAISAIFYMRRRDIVAQGVSLYRSVASGLFHSTESDLAAYARFKVVPYDETAIAKWIDDLLESERAFEAMFVRCGLAPIPLVYEDLEAVPHRAISLMATMLGAQPPSAIPISQYRILRDEISIEWSTRFKKNCSSYVQRVNDQRSNITSL